jgi:hypothetical protein
VDKPELEVQYDDWHAVHDHMSKALRVYGNVTVRGGGFALGLEPNDEQGINPLMLMLNLLITPTGESPSRQTAEYEQSWNDDGLQYEEVGFVVEGDIVAPPPPTLRIEDVY